MICFQREAWWMKDGDNRHQPTFNEHQPTSNLNTNQPHLPKLRPAVPGPALGLGALALLRCDELGTASSAHQAIVGPRQAHEILLTAWHRGTWRIPLRRSPWEMTRWLISDDHDEVRVEFLKVMNHDEPTGCSFWLRFCLVNKLLLTAPNGFEETYVVKMMPIYDGESWVSGSNYQVVTSINLIVCALK